MKLFIYHIDLEYYPSEHWESVVMAESRKQADQILWEQEKKDLDLEESGRIRFLKEEVSQCLEIDLTLDLEEYCKTDRFHKSIDFPILKL